MNDDIVAFVDRAVAAVEPLVAAVSAADHVRSTPCEDFDLGTLVAHLIGGLRGFADVGDGKPLRFDADPDLTTERASEEYRKAADRLVAAFRRPGMLERSFAMPWGDTTGAQLMGFELIELVVHGWDIGRSRGRAIPFDDDLVEATLIGARQWVDDSTRTPQLFGPEVPVPADAPVLDRLVGFLGRHPGWAPATHRA
jgi:uncharacterized protein (TIGR03086 family)